MKIGVTSVFISLSAFFLAYSISIYLQPLSEKNALVFTKQKVADGKLIWQKYNCQCCHQLFGLGGYLGPDLTNTISNDAKSEKYMRAVIQSGIKQMPAFSIPEKDLVKLFEFLKSTDLSGKADPRLFHTNGIGMIHQNDNQKGK